MSKACETSTDYSEDTLDDTIPWSVKTSNHKDIYIGETNSDEINTSDIETGSSDDNMDINEDEDLTESTCVSDYIKQNPTITQQNTNFEEVTFDQNTIIKASWRAALIHIWPGCIVSHENGALYLAREEKTDLKIVGENSKYGISVTGEIIEG